MQYSRPMIDLVMQIRKFVPSGLKPEVKLANPELFNILIGFYHNNTNTVTNALIKELFFLAGDSWSQRLQNDSGLQETKKQTMRVYRGQIQVNDTVNPEENTKKKATKKVYRGQIVYE